MVLTLKPYGNIYGSAVSSIGSLSIKTDHTMQYNKTATLISFHRWIGTNRLGFTFVSAESIENCSNCIYTAFSDALHSCDKKSD